MPGTLTIGQAPLTITADDQTMTYGGALPALTASYTGLVNGDTSAAISGLTLSTTAATSGVGSYPITASNATDPNYSISYVPGTLTIGQAPLTITADDQTMTYGGALPPLTASYTGLVNGDTSAAISGLTLSTVAATSAAGSYPITASGAADPNYSISYVPGTLTIGPATLTVTADDQVRPYDAPDPTFTASYSGFVNDDTLATSGVTGSPSLSSSDTSSSPVGTYPIVAAQGTLASQDYAFSFVSGILTVTQALTTLPADQSQDSSVPYLTATSNIAYVIGPNAALAVTGPVTLDSGGSVSVESSVLTVSEVVAEPGAGIEVDDGTLQASSDFSTSAPITIDSGGGTIDSGGFNVALTGGLSGPGGLTTTGAGTVTLAGVNSYSGGTTVAAGTLIVANPSAIPASTSLTVGAGAASLFASPLQAAPSLVSAAATPVTAGPAMSLAQPTASVAVVAVQPVVSDAASQSAAHQANAAALPSAPPAVAAAPSRTPAASPLAGPRDDARVAADLAWFEPAASSFDGPEPQHQQDLAIWALDAVFAEYGR